MPTVCSRWLFLNRILSTNLSDRVAITEQQWIKECKNKNGRYGKLSQIIGSSSTLHVAYLMIKSNARISAKRVDKKIFDDKNLNSFNKMSKKVLSRHFKILTVRRVLIPKTGKDELWSLKVSTPREKIVQKATEIVLTTIFENVFLNCSPWP